MSIHTSFDPIRNARESGYSNVPAFLLDSSAGAGTTDTPGEAVTGTAPPPVNWALVLTIASALLVLWRLKR